MTVQLAKWLMNFTIKIVLLISTLTLTACAGDAVRPDMLVAGSVASAESMSHAKPSELTASGSLPENLIEAPVRVAIMLPLSGDKQETGKALLGAASMALFDAYDPRITLLPFDTMASAQGAASAVVAVLQADVDVVLGPLFAESIQVVGPVLAEANITMIGFSSDTRVAALGQFIMGFAPEEEVKRIMQYAIGKGHSNFAALIPLGLYGKRVLTALGDVLEDSDARMMAMEEYAPVADSIFDPVKNLANYASRKKTRDQELKAMEAIDSDVSLDIIKELETKEVIGEVNYTAVLVPEGGQLLRTIAPLLPYYEVDPAKVKLLGTGLWNDISILKEPPLQGAWFAAPEPDKPAEFMRKYEAIYGSAPPRIATLAYDAMALVAWRIRNPIAEERYTAAALLDVKGFQGIDGLFRFKADGTVERALAILEVDKDGFKVIDRAPRMFPRFHNYVIRPLEK